VTAQRRGFARAVQARFAEPEEADDGEKGERDGGEIDDACGCPLGEQTAGKGTADECTRLHDSHAADPLLVHPAGPGLLQHSVVDDAVHRAGVHREIDPENHRRHYVGDDVPAQAADQDTHS
jgi:hypothetical protein